MTSTHKIARYHFRSYDERVQPLPPTNDLDEALVATAVYPMDIWDARYERFVSPIETDTEYQEVLYRLNSKRRGKIKPRWDNIFLASVICGIVSYSVYFLINTPQP